MYLKLKTIDIYLKVITSALSQTLGAYPIIAYNESIHYKICNIGPESLKQIGWILDYYPNTKVTISDNLDA